MHSKMSSLEMRLNVFENTKIWCLGRTPQPHIFIRCFVELVVQGCAPVGSSSWMPSCLQPTVISIKSGLPNTQLNSWHCHVVWIQSGLCCAYSRLLSQELDVNPNFLFGGTTQTHSKTLDSDGLSTSCYLCWKASKPHHLVWVKQIYGICFFHVAQMSIATLLETHFLESKVYVDSHAQDTIRTDTTFHQLWLCNASVYVWWLTEKWEHITCCGRSTTLSYPQNVTSSLRTCGMITHYLDIWCIIVHVQIFKCSLFGQSKLNNS
jgi:hypothetical protein